MIRVTGMVGVAIAAFMLLMAQAQSTTYARVVYLKAKPGMADAQLKLQREVGDKGAAGSIAAGPSSGYVRMGRVFPTSHEAGHDVMYFYTRPTPPDFAAPPRDDFFKAAGISREEWFAKSSAVADNVKQEIWPSLFAHGSLAKGDTVRLRRYAAPRSKLPEARVFWKDWAWPIRGDLLQRGVAKGMHGWELRLMADSAQPQFAVLETYEKGDGPFRAFGDRQAAFLKVHPGKDYHTYSQMADSFGGTADSVIYRVETVIGK